MLTVECGRIGVNYIAGEAHGRRYHRGIGPDRARAVAGAAKMKLRWRLIGIQTPDEPRIPRCQRSWFA